MWIVNFKFRITETNVDMVPLKNKDNVWFPELFDEQDWEDNQEVSQDRKQDYGTDQQE